jgi:hypothetical protein
MMIIGCDLHTRYQQIAMVDTDSGELVERRLEHESGEARAFYAGLKGAVRVGIEATGHTAWFEALLAELGRAEGAPLLALFEKWDADSSHQGLGLSAASERDTCAWKKRIEQAAAPKVRERLI